MDELTSPSRKELAFVAIGLALQALLLVSAWAVGRSQYPRQASILPVVTVAQEPECTPCPVCYLGIQHAAYLPLVMASEPPASGKKGVGVPYPKPWACAALADSGVAWYYNWSNYDVSHCSGVTFYPMLNRASQAGWETEPAEWLLGYNEFDLPGDNYSTPHDSAVGWRAIEQNHPEKKLVSPSTAYMGPEYDNYLWLKQMRDEYHALYGGWPRFDALAVHCYGTIARCQAHISIGMSLATGWGISEVWATELGYVPQYQGGGLAEQLGFMSTMVGWLEAQPMITHYAWFSLGWDTDVWAGLSLYDYTTGERTPLGDLYRTLP